MTRYSRGKPIERGLWYPTKDIFLASILQRCIYIGTFISVLLFVKVVLSNIIAYSLYEKGQDFLDTLYSNQHGVASGRFAVEHNTPFPQTKQKGFKIISVFCDLFIVNKQNFDLMMRHNSILCSRVLLSITKTNLTETQKT